MKITIEDFRPNTDLLQAWAEANDLGNPLSIRLPITVDLAARTIGFTRVPPRLGGAFVEGSSETWPLRVELPEAVMAIVGMKDDEIVYPAVMI